MTRDGLLAGAGVVVALCLDVLFASVVIQVITRDVRHAWQERRWDEVVLWMAGAVLMGAMVFVLNVLAFVGPVTPEAP